MVNRYILWFLEKTESSGLGDEFQNYGKNIKINHSEKIDSLNLPVSIGIALYQFSKDKFRVQKK